MTPKIFCDRAGLGAVRIQDNEEQAAVSETTDELVKRLELEPHPEGGFYRESYRADLTLPSSALPNHGGARSAGTSILYLLPYGEVSAWHRIASDELWLLHGGDVMELTMRQDDQADSSTRRIGLRDELQVLVPAGWWQTATPAEGPSGFSLVGCVVVPGFDFADFEMA